MLSKDNPQQDDCSQESGTATIYDVARCAKVSVATVSRALNGSGYVSAAARERVEKAVRELGYQPNALAQALSGRPSSVWGFLAPELDDPYWSEVAETVDALCLQQGINLVVGASHWEADDEMQAARLIARYRPDGVLLCTPLCYETIDFLRSRQISVVVRGNCAEHPQLDVDQVVSDEPQAMYLLTRHLIDQGHRRIVFVGYGVRDSVPQPRYAGYSRALAEVGLTPSYLPWKSTIDRGRALQELSALMSAPNAPTAFVAASDYMAIHTWDWLETCQVRIPEQVSLTGYGGSGIGRLIRSGLTTIDDHSVAQTELMVSILQQRTKTKAAAEPRKVIVPTKLTVRGSTGLAPGALHK